MEKVPTTEDFRKSLEIQLGLSRPKRSAFALRRLTRRALELRAGVERALGAAAPNWNFELHLPERGAGAQRVLTVRGRGASLTLSLTPTRYGFRSQWRLAGPASGQTSWTSEDLEPLLAQLEEVAEGDVLAVALEASAVRDAIELVEEEMRWRYLTYLRTNEDSSLRGAEREELFLTAHGFYSFPNLETCLPRRDRRVVRREANKLVSPLPRHILVPTLASAAASLGILALTLVVGIAPLAAFLGFALGGTWIGVLELRTAWQRRAEAQDFARLLAPMLTVEGEARARAERREASAHG